MIMSFLDLPNEVIILICQYGKIDKNCIINVPYKDMQLESIHNLVSSCKHFGFLKKMSYLVHANDDNYRNEKVFKSVNYYGNTNGPDYLMRGDHYVGYADEKCTLSRFWWKNDFDTLYWAHGDDDDDDTDIFHWIDVIGLFKELYTNVKDVDVTEFLLTNRNNYSILIGDSFPKINVSVGYIKELINKYEQKL